MSRKRYSATSRYVPALLGAVFALGCASTTLRSGKPPGEAAPGYYERWHAAFLFGAVPFDSNYDLAHLCPNGWSEVRLTADPFTALSSLITAFLYSPSRLTIICAKEDPRHPPPLPQY